MFETEINRYLSSHHLAHIRLRAVLFDMDGVLFDSMPYHADAWAEVMNRHGLRFSREEAFLHEGRTGAATINIAYNRQYGHDAPPELIEQIYAEKSAAFASRPEPGRMPGAPELLRKIQAQGLVPVLVTGSGQRTLLERLGHQYPGVFAPERMVTAFDVKHGKPHPEPYLMGLQKAGVQAHEAVVVENAPIGVQAGHAAGIFTIAVNTGPLDGQVLLDAGADLLFPSMQALCENWEELYRNLSAV
ncbi:MAG TPA: HAD-IA family hydrolase [Candidatus Bacteroides pullicola]|uniref:HAD-IA family hydrolase n=1 Tax=Candidatus Bacteroides pullicola TaxID=2838475 RepID=A0A9D1ZHQ9_9BACE|nr:HAD-IA family hydrolase [Candidatus Bacteroides pullicola]